MYAILIFVHIKLFWIFWLGKKLRGVKVFQEHYAQVSQDTKNRHNPSKFNYERNMLFQISIKIHSATISYFSYDRKFNDNFLISSRRLCRLELGTIQTTPLLRASCNCKHIQCSQMKGRGKQKQDYSKTQRLQYYTHYDIRKWKMTKN